MREVAVFSLASHMVWCLWGLKQVKMIPTIILELCKTKMKISHPQGQTSSIPFAYYHFARDKLEDYREAKARAESILMLDENVVHS